MASRPPLERGGEPVCGPRRGEQGQSPGEESGVIVFGGGSGCAGRGCLFWILVSVVISVALTVLANLALVLFSGGGAGLSA